MESNSPKTHLIKNKKKHNFQPLDLEINFMKSDSNIYLSKECSQDEIYESPDEYDIYPNNLKSKQHKNSKAENQSNTKTQKLKIKATQIS
jgi:hypothetical protein